MEEIDAVIGNNGITDSAGIMIGNSDGVTVENNMLSAGIQSTRTLLATGDGCEFVMRVAANFDAGIVIKGPPASTRDH